MKRSKIFMGLATLAVAGFGASSYAANYTATQVYYQAVPGNPASCQQTDIDFDCPGGQETCISFDDQHANSYLKPLFLDPVCLDPLTKPE